MFQQSLEDEMKFNAQDLEAYKLTTDTTDLKIKKDAFVKDTSALEDTFRDSYQQSV